MCRGVPLRVLIPHLHSQLSMIHCSLPPLTPNAFPANILLCIGCGRCAKVCHAGLLPSEIVRRLENMHYERLAGLHPEDCDGCGACSYVCPSGREVALRVTEAAHAHGTIFLDWGEEDEA